MSSIQVQTVLEGLTRPSTLRALSRKTQYPPDRVLAYIVKARAEGNIIRAVARKGEATYYERISND